MATGEFFLACCHEMSSSRGKSAASIGPFELARSRLRGMRQLWDLVQTSLAPLTFPWRIHMLNMHSRPPTCRHIGVIQLGKFVDGDLIGE
jgi:hypothetical protein